MARYTIRIIVVIFCVHASADVWSVDACEQTAGAQLVPAQLLIEAAGPPVPESAIDIVSKLKRIDEEEAGQYSKDKHLRWDVSFARLKKLEHVGPAIWVRMLGEKDPYVRACAADVLGVSKESRAIDPLIATLRDASPIVRSCAALALGRIRHRRAVPALIQAMQDQSHGVRRQVAKALGQIASPDATTALIRAITEKGDGASCDVYTPMVIVAMWQVSHPGPYNEPASWALAEIGPPAVKDLAAVLENSTGTKDAYIAWSLGQIALKHQDKGAIESLMSAREHADPNVREFIAETLTKIDSAKDNAKR